MEVENNANPPPSSSSSSTEPAATAATVPPPSSTAAPVPPAGNERFTIKKWNGVSLWSWDISVETCAICRNPIMDLCIECQANSQTSQASECTIAWGACNVTLFFFLTHTTYFIGFFLCIACFPQSLHL